MKLLACLACLGLSIALATPLWSLQQDQPDKGPDAQQVSAIVDRLESAFDGKDPAKQIEALQAATDVPHSRVVKAIEPAMKSKTPDVLRAALESLGRMGHGEALERLISYGKKERRALDKDPDLAVLLTKSIGRHGSLEALDFLTDKIFNADPDLSKARLIAIANIRDRKAVEALFQLMKSTDRRRIQNHMRQFQLALAQLCGVDNGAGQDRWQAWWRGVDKDWKVSEKPAPLPEQLQRQWDSFWGNQRRYERNTDRQRRGQDPEEDGGRRKRRGEGDG